MAYYIRISEPWRLSGQVLTLDLQDAGQEASEWHGVVVGSTMEPEVVGQEVELGRRHRGDQTELDDRPIVNVGIRRRAGDPWLFYGIGSVRTSPSSSPRAEVRLG